MTKNQAQMGGQRLSSPRWQQKQQGNLLNQLLLTLQQALKGAETGNLYDETVAPCWRLYLGSEKERERRAVEDVRRDCSPERDQSRKSECSIVLRVERQNQTRSGCLIDFDYTTCNRECVVSYDCSLHNFVKVGFIYMLYVNSLIWVEVHAQYWPLSRIKKSNSCCQLSNSAELHNKSNKLYIKRPKQSLKIFLIWLCFVIFLELKLTWHQNKVLLRRADVLHTKQSIRLCLYSLTYYIYLKQQHLLQTAYAGETAVEEYKVINCMVENHFLFLFTVLLRHVQFLSCIFTINPVTS